MEDKQLDFNAPLLSVRRFNLTPISRLDDDKKPSNLPTLSETSTPLYKSDFKSGPLRNPGTVPFQWELSPGRPKDVALESERFDKACIIPKLPPGRKIGQKHRSFAKVEKSEYSMIGQLKNTVNSPKFQDSKDEEKQMIHYYPNLYSDAFDGLSFSMNYSFTGMSATNGSEMKSSKNFQGEWNPQNFMMARFLPAAKEIALKAPSCPSRKQLGFMESVKEEKITYERKEPIDRSKIHVIPKYTPDGQVKDDDDDEYDGDSEFTTKACGLFPGLCLGSSVGLLNPLSGMKIRNRVPLSTVHKDNNHTKAIHHKSNGEAIDQEFNNNKHKMIHGLNFLGDLKDKKCVKDDDINQNAKEYNLRYLLDKEAMFDLISENSTHGKTKEQNDSGDKDAKKDDKQQKVLESPKPHFSHCSDKLGNDEGMKNTGELQSKRNDYAELEDDIAEMESLKIPIHGGFHEVQDSKNSKESSLCTSFHVPLPPPLPQSPSESWLRHALPSISSKNPSIDPYLGSKIHFKKQSF